MQSLLAFYGKKTSTKSHLFYVENNRFTLILKREQLKQLRTTDSFPSHSSSSSTNERKLNFVSVLHESRIHWGEHDRHSSNMESNPSCRQNEHEKCTHTHTFEKWKKETHCWGQLCPWTNIFPPSLIATALSHALQYENFTKY